MLVSASACSSDSNSAADANSVKTFDVDASGDVGAVPDPEPALPEGGRSLEAVIIDAPPSVAPNERFDFVVELRNPMMEPIALSPCPWFHAVFGESGTVTNAVGELPCDDLGPIASGGRVRLRIPMTAPHIVATDEGGFWASLDWRLGNTGSVLARDPPADARRLTRRTCDYDAPYDLDPGLGEKRTGIASGPEMKFDGGAAWISRELQVGQPAQQLGEHHVQLQASQRGTQAEVRTEPEREVRVRIAAHVESLGILEHVGSWFTAG